MNYGINFLKDVKQNYIQYGVERQLNLSQKVYNFLSNGVPVDECMMIYKGWDPTIEITSKDEFERFIDVHCAQDPRAYENGILFCTNDIDKIRSVVRTMLGYYMDKDYEAAIDGIIMTFSPKKTRKIQKSNIIDNN